MKERIDEEKSFWRRIQKDFKDKPPVDDRFVCQTERQYFKSRFTLATFSCFAIIKA